MSLKIRGGSARPSDMTGAADSGSVPSELSESTASALKEDILAPRFYTTNFAKLDKMDFSNLQVEFEAMLGEFRKDYNKGHFIPTEEFKADFPDLPREEFEEFL